MHSGLRRRQVSMLPLNRQESFLLLLTKRYWACPLSAPPVYDILWVLYHRENGIAE